MTELKEQILSETNEKICSAELENGLKVFLIPKQDFQESCGMMTVNFDSSDTKFTHDRQSKEHNGGTTHFLEYKLPRLEDGQNVAELFTNAGADNNAFTTFDKIYYYFSVTDSLEENVTLLQQFIPEAFFTEASTTREKDIIDQEVDMYQDDADCRLYQGILENLYPNTALAQDIAGTQKSIENISVVDLKKDHNIFYFLQEMTSLLVGNLDKDLLFNQIKKGQEEKASKEHVVKRQGLVYEQVVSKKNVQIGIAQPKLAIGYRGAQLPKGTSILRQELALWLFSTMLLGWTLKRYRQFYESGQIDDFFDLKIEVCPGFQSLIISLDILEPIATVNNIRQYLNKVSQPSGLDDLSEEHFRIVKEGLYSDLFKSLDPIGDLPTQLINHLSEGETYPDVPKVLTTLDSAEVLKIGNGFLTHVDATEFTILPK